MGVPWLPRKLDDPTYDGNFDAGGNYTKVFNALIIIMSFTLVDVPACRRVKVVR